MPPEDQAPEYTAGLLKLSLGCHVIAVVKAPVINVYKACIAANSHINRTYSAFGYINLTSGFYYYIPDSAKVLAITLDTVYADYAGQIYYLTLTEKGIRKGFRVSQKTFESFMTTQPPEPLNKLEELKVNPETEATKPITLVDSIVNCIKQSVERDESTCALEWAKVLEIVIQRGIK